MANLEYLSIKEAHELLSTKQVSAAELVQNYLDRIKKLDSKIRSHLIICAEHALTQAAKVDKKLASGQAIGLLEGIPYTAKDMFLTRGIRTTAASHILENFVPPYSATVIDKLDAAGAILIAKVNQDEFAHGGSTENSGFHPTHNPWNLDHVPGGSSGGSASAVAADFGIFSLGTDTGGSIRQPAAYCGVVGLKPTYGLVSRYGVVAMASSLDCIGPITRSVEDATIVLEVIAGRDEKDSTTIGKQQYSYSLAGSKGKKLGVIKEYINDLDQQNLQKFEEAKLVLENCGYEISEVSLVNIKHALSCYYILTPSEISSNLSRYDGVRYGYSDARATNLSETYFFSRGHGFGKEVKRRVMIGTYALSAGYYDAYYKKAMQVRTLIKQDFNSALDNLDALIGPTTPDVAFKLGENVVDPIKMYLTDIMTVAANLAGIPAITVPSGLINNLPTGLQIMASQSQENAIFSIANDYEKAVNLSGMRPSL